MAVMTRLVLLSIPLLLPILGLALAEDTAKRAQTPAEKALARGKKLFSDTQGDYYPSCAQNTWLSAPIVLPHACTKVLAKPL